MLSALERLLSILRRPNQKASLSRTLALSGNMQLPWIGYRIFKWLLLTIFLLLLVVLLYARQTYPTAQDLSALGSTTQGADRLAELQSLRDAWLSSVKDFGQLFVLTPFLPLLGAVIGYIFGVSRQKDGKTDSISKDGRSEPDAAAVTPG